MSSSEKTDESNAKTRKRDFFRFGKKGEEEKKNKAKPPTQPEVLSSAIPSAGGLRPNSPLTPGASSPRAHPYGSPASPGRQALRSASPRTHSPASSMIFERNVQDEAPAQASSHIPSHIVTEDHIPPALDATSEAITNSKLDPDTVEIVTHASHQPAAASLTGTTHDSMVSSIHEDLAASFSRHDTDNVSNYGSLDVGDVRRLSFISFADVVHAEQEMGEHRRDSTQMSSLSGHPALSAPRSPSPMRSPLSSEAYGTSPSTSITPSVKGQEVSPGRNLRGPSSPLPGSASPGPVGELNIETMRQALRKTGSGDLSGFRSPFNAASVEEGNFERPTR